MDTPLLTILLADPQTLVRQGVRSLLQGSGKYQVVEETANGAAVVDDYVRCRPDILVLDIAISGRDGVSVIREIKKLAPEARIVVLTMLAAKDIVYNALRCGADAYVLKDASLDELLLALDAVIHGRSYVSSGISALLIDGLRQAEPLSRIDERWHLLTPREREVLHHVSKGKKTWEIADCLHRSIKTVEKHRANIKRKLGTKSTTEMRAFGVRFGLLRGDPAGMPPEEDELLPPDPAAP